MQLGTVGDFSGAQRYAVSVILGTQSDEANAEPKVAVLRIPVPKLKRCIR